MKISESGNGRNILVLHGGGGPATMAGLAAHLAEQAYVITPTHPGWDGTPRPESLQSIAALADAYVRYLDEHDVKDVLVVGSSLGGWLGAEIALRDTAHRVTGLVIINGVGVDIPGHPITNISRFTPPEIAKVAYHDPTHQAGARRGSRRRGTCSRTARWAPRRSRCPPRMGQLPLRDERIDHARRGATIQPSMGREGLFSSN
jgi:pimeloyl-ACP methyl ester carboxylesterase